MDSTFLALRFHETGDPAKVLQAEHLPVVGPGRGEVRVKVLAASINPADINIIEGVYGKKPKLPAIPGNEGVCEVVELGEGVRRLKVGDCCILPTTAGSWCEQLTISEEELLVVPGNVDPIQASMLRVNPPTAWRMLHDFCELEEGDWMIQNAANSAVGRCVIQIAKSKGWRTVNVVRRMEVADELKALGADIVIEDNRESYREVASLVDDAPIRLGLNAVGGDSALGVAACLAEGGVHVTFGAMSKSALKIPNGFLIFKDVQFRGYWVTRWFERSSRSEQEEMFGELAAMMSRGELDIAVDSTFGLADHAEAVERAMTEKREGKVVFVNH